MAGVAHGIPTSCYLLCCSPRTGSWLVAEGLAATGLAGRPDEYFSEEKEILLAGEPLAPAPDVLRRWLQAVRERGSTPNGVLGLKAHLDQLEHLMFRLSMAPVMPGLSVRATLDSVLPPMTMIWTRRRDKVRQAVSWGRALQTGVWFAIDGLRIAQHAEPAFNPEMLLRLHRRLLVQEAAWREFFSAYGSSPIVIDYEDLEYGYPSVLPGLLDRLGLPGDATVAPPRLRKQADDLSEGWVERLRPLVEGVRA
jgi:trehalose 2-sulfotransferase